MTIRNGKSNYFWVEDEILIKSFLMAASIFLRSNLESLSQIGRAQTQQYYAEIFKLSWCQQIMQPGGLCSKLLPTPFWQ